MTDPVTVTVAFQANCDRCGWHTPFCTPKSAVTEWARLHRISCPPVSDTDREGEGR